MSRTRVERVIRASCSTRRALARRDPSFKLGDHMPTAVDMLSWQGKPYALPIGMSTSAVAYNAALFPVQTNNTRELQDETFEWNVVPLPKGKKGTVYPLSSFSYGIYNNTRQPDLAWKLWTLVVGPTGQREWMLKTGEFIPSHKSLAGEYEKLSLRPFNRKVFLQAVANGRPTPKATK